MRFAHSRRNVLSCTTELWETPGRRCALCSRYLETSREHYRNARKALEDLAVNPRKTPIHPQYVTRLLDQLAAQDAIFTCDVGTPTIWAVRYLSMNAKRGSSAPSIMAPWQRAAADDWRASQSSGAPGGLLVRRRRLCNVNGGDFNPALLRPLIKREEGSLIRIAATSQPG